LQEVWSHGHGHHASRFRSTLGGGRVIFARRAGRRPAPRREER
jgi:hypothetical protein